MKPILKAYNSSENIYSTGQTNDKFYYVNEGTIELSESMSSGKKIVFGKLGPGSFFGDFNVGENEIVNTHTATSLGFSRIYIIDLNYLQTLFAKMPKIMQSFLMSKIKESQDLYSKLKVCSSVSKPLVVFSQVLELHAKNKLENHSHSIVDTSLAYQDTLQVLGLASGTGVIQVEHFLSEMVKLNLISIEGTLKNKRIYIRSEDIVEDTKRIDKRIGDKLLNDFEVAFELISVGELSELVGVGKGSLLKTISKGEITEELFLIRKHVALDILEKEGKKAFNKSVIKTAEDIESIYDLEYISNDIISDALSSLEIYDVALLMNKIPENIKDKVESLYSERMLTIIKDTADSIVEFDAISAEALEYEFVAQVKISFSKKR